MAQCSVVFARIHHTLCRHAVPSLAVSLAPHTHTHSRGELVQGTVMHIEPGGVHIEIGAKAAAFMPAREASLLPIASLGDVVDIGETREFQIIRCAPGRAWCSVNSASCCGVV